MKKYAILLIILAFSSCTKDPIKTENTNNVNFQVELLFEYDSIKVYRFFDGRMHYFTKNMTISTHSCGKNCTYQETIQTK